MICWFRQTSMKWKPCIFFYMHTINWKLILYNHSFISYVQLKVTKMEYPLSKTIYQFIFTTVNKNWSSGLDQPPPPKKQNKKTWQYCQYCSSAYTGLPLIIRICVNVWDQSIPVNEVHTTWTGSTITENTVTWASCLVNLKFPFV